VGWFNKNGVKLGDWITGQMPAGAEDAIQFNMKLGKKLVGASVDIPLDFNLPGFSLDIDGGCPVNPSGGFLSSGEATTAQGVLQVCELVWQLRGQAQGRQVQGARLGMSAVLGLGANGASVILKT
jgi:hypothetical protein